MNLRACFSQPPSARKGSRCLLPSRKTFPTAPGLNKRPTSKAEGTLNDGDTVKSGERVEVVLTIEGKNNYEYLLFEDLKPGGLEAVQIRSGENLYV
ncbi:MAG TPA: hypothetical protein VES69_01375 [Pyrinomonadaceae bacterium]|nr:hypothetical protein [Pyrinomonadaceae bacterium]